MILNGGKIVLKVLSDLGVKDIFGYPGGAVIPLYNELYDQYDIFNHYRTSHEQGAVHAADGYARTTNKVGICFATSGPGATNTITGIANAYMDSIPLVVITGQVPRVYIGKDSFQEIDITGVTMSITKHNYLVEDINDLERVVKEAYSIAKSGRPGPVLIDIPKDVFNCEAEYKNITVEDENINANSDTSDLDKAIELIKNSKKPVIYAGGGIKSSKAEKELLAFVERLNIPVVNTLMGLGGFPRDHEKALGLIGMHGFTEANLAVTHSDLVIAIGARFSDRVIGKSDEFAKNATVIHIDLDQTELDKNIYSKVKITGNAKDVLKEMLDKIDFDLDTSNWISEIESFRQVEKYTPEEFHPGNILRTINGNLPENTIVATDVGQHQMWTAQYWNFKHTDTWVTSAGLGTMGFGLGAAIGAKAGNRDRAVVLVTGDGSFRMNSNELPVLVEYDLPILIVLFNNNTLGMVRQWQKLFQDKRYAETDIKSSIDYVKLTSAYGIEGKQVNTLKELEEAMASYDMSKSLLIECNISTDEDVLPIIPPGKAINDFIL